MTRRDYTNQHGYACPTEAQAIYNADRKPDPPRKRSPSVMYEEDIKAMDKPRPEPSVLRDSSPRLNRSRSISAGMFSGLFDIFLRQMATPSFSG